MDSFLHASIVSPEKKKSRGRCGEYSVDTNVELKNERK
jgi:hypothetical protein